MITNNSDGTYLGLPLTEEQNSEVLHYFNRKKRLGMPIDEQEVKAMIGDMLHPPSLDDVDSVALGSSKCQDEERSRFSVDDIIDSTEAHEDKGAMMELEAMKRAGS